MKLKSSNFKFYLGGVYLIVLFIAIYFLFSNFDISDLASYELIRENKDLILKYKENNIFFMTVIFFLITIVINLLLCPMLLPTLIIGFIFGKWLGTLILLFGIIPTTFVTAALGSGIEKIIDKNAEISFLPVIQSPEIYLPIIGFFIILIIAFFIKRIFFKQS